MDRNNWNNIGLAVKRAGFYSLPCLPLWALWPWISNSTSLTHSLLNSKWRKAVHTLSKVPSRNWGRRSTHSLRFLVALTVCISVTVNSLKEGIFYFWTPILEQCLEHSRPPVLMCQMNDRMQPSQHRPPQWLHGRFLRNICWSVSALLNQSAVDNI